MTATDVSDTEPSEREEDEDGECKNDKIKCPRRVIGRSEHLNFQRDGRICNFEHVFVSGKCVIFHLEESHDHVERCRLVSGEAVAGLWGVEEDADGPQLLCKPSLGVMVAVCELED